MSHPQLYEADPFRPLNWRAERVITLLNESGRPRRATRHDDEYIKRYRLFLRRWRDAGTPSQKQLLFPPYPDLYHAQRIVESPDKEMPAVLEARILTGASNLDIAGEMATSPAVVRAYEKLFFNVRDRLDQLDYIRNMVLMPAIRDAALGEERNVISHERRHAAYRLLAYVGGTTVLDFILFGFERSAKPQRQAQLQDWMDRSFSNMVRQKGLLALQSFDFNKYTVMQLLDLTRSVVQLAEEGKRAGGGAVTEFQANVEAYINEVKLQIGSSASRNLPAELVEWETKSIEPRADDYTAITSGVTPEDLTAYEGYKRPEATPKEQ